MGLLEDLQASSMILKKISQNLGKSLLNVQYPNSTVLRTLHELQCPWPSDQNLVSIQTQET